jgi:hypothetical protein
VRPAYIIKEMLDIKSADEFKRKLKAGLKVLTSNPGVIA